MLPLALICLLQAQLAFAQSAQPLSLNSLYTSPPPGRSRPTLFSLPTSSSNVSVSVALCAASANAPRFFLSNDTNVSLPGPDDVGEAGVYEIALSNGFGWWTGALGDGGYLAVTDGGQIPFEIGVSDGGAMHNMTDTWPLLGDTTGNQALLFSPPLAPPPPSNPPTYPNYTLAPANLTLPTADPSLAAGLSLFVAPTSSLGQGSLPLTGCAMQQSNISGGVTLDSKSDEHNGLWLKDDEGWRFQWLVSGLSAQTNYTAYVIQGGTKLSGPINFVTKSVSFPCALVHSLPYCPSIAYAVPINVPPKSPFVHTSNTLPDDFVQPLLDTLTNFSISLTTFACGRDEYSPLVSCNDCQIAYRKWLCTVWFSRCSEAAPEAPAATDAQKPISLPTSALSAVPASATPRVTTLPAFSKPYNTLLPCLETCTAVDRACPNFIGFKCPVKRFNAALSYGVGYIDTGEEGEQGGGLTGVAQDRFGNVWCNAG